MQGFLSAYEDSLLQLHCFAHFIACQSSKESNSYIRYWHVNYCMTPRLHICHLHSQSMLHVDASSARRKQRPCVLMFPGLAPELLLVAPSVGLRRFFEIDSKNHTAQRFHELNKSLKTHLFKSNFYCIFIQHETSSLCGFAKKQRNADALLQLLLFIHF